VYCPKVNLIFSFEKYSKEVKLYSPGDMKLREKLKVPLRIEGFVTSIDYSDSHLMFGATSTDVMIHFWLQRGKGVKYFKGIEAPCIQNKVRLM
jgi:WD40 repeat protein